MAQPNPAWQSKLVLLAVIPFAAVAVLLEAHWWAVNYAPLAVWTLGLSLLLGMVAYRLRSATPWAAAAGAVIAACLMFSTAVVPYQPWRTALIPVLAVLVLTSLSTRLGRTHKERLGTAEKRQGRSASQVAANLGVAAFAANELVQSWMIDSGWFAPAALMHAPVFAPMLAALAEAAADTVSSEIGQVLGGRPRMITTLRAVDPGTDGAISLAGTLAGFVAAGIVSAAGSWALGWDWTMLSIAWAGGVFGLFFDSLLGATLERYGWLNNDLVNFLSTGSAAAFTLGAMVAMPHLGFGR